VKGEKMFCPECRCEFVEWIRICTDCKIPLIEELPPVSESIDKTISYEALVNLVKENGNKLKIDLLTKAVARNKRWNLPFQGYGLAWANKGIFTFTLRE